jgi:O-antigen/teichoic acid export membrane protein
VAFAHVFYGMYYVFTSGLNVTNRTYYFPFIILAAAAFNILANYLLIPRLQLIAPAFITAVSYGILAFLTYFYSQKFYDIPFEFRRILLLFGVFFSFGILGYYWNYRQPVVFFTVKIVMLLLPVITLYLCKFFKPEELNFIKTRVFKLFYG